MTPEYQEPANLRDYVSLLRRRRALIFAIFSIMSLTIIGGTSMVEDQFRSTAIIAIERPEIPESMVRTTVAYYDTDLRIDRVTNAVLGRERVEGWVTEHNLYPNLTDESLDDAVAEFRSDVQIITIQEDEDIASKDQGDTIAFEVSYFGQTSADAYDMAGILANEYIEENRRTRNRSVEETLMFFEREASALQSRIDETEQKLATFKEENAAIMPESSTLVVQIVERTERELEDVQREMRDLRESKQLLQGEIADVSPYSVVYSSSGETLLSDSERLKFLEREYIQLASKYGAEHPDVIRARRELTLLRESDGGRDIQTVRIELDAAKMELASLNDRYTSDHPDVRDARRRVGLLEGELRALELMPVARSTSEPDNPAYIQLQVRIRAADKDLVALAFRERELRARLREYDTRMLMAPQVERELLSLTRDYEQSIREYNEVREKQNDARRAKELELAEKGERYVLQVPPNEPFTAAFPDRIAIIVLGIVFSIGAGVGVAVIAEAIDGTVRSARDLKTLTGMPPIVIVPILETAIERRGRMMRWSSSIAVVSVLLVSLISIQLL